MRRPRPVIGITAAHCTEELKTFPRTFYVDSIRKVGGIPIVLPPVQSRDEGIEVLDLVDGLVLTGGGDISPAYLNEDPLRGIGGCIPERDLSELLLSELALQRDLPLLGICRGIQVLAVAVGGKIYQDIPSQHSGAFQHSQTAPRQHTWHKVEIVQESLLFRLLGEKGIGVNSLHHQAVREVPSGFRLNALAADGIIEGIEKSDAKFCLGVQWHPESMMETEKHSGALFHGFVEACHKAD
ncbi:gamma-glutamyl-gamma-aminobutyrate hydrolase family protein [Desulfosporosinus sp. PR]|uniref:gamma-glutamyl-gamma-aminobutyrate hydrolase family protein n=1 Tax=Candidatus Desulfosporosinus nitrosoreducens TaxID=3401928 RepID=UPI0027F204C8|nr:gamma-glutamyl-gamma-aminobutyrate hydrolase family protein [Desulfosporosinus sp. PR]MDQ7093123.1 gamma-glutamyl-gamma-aminobutyrate hydrolase family protein [Desulfosporosinus sp. PR]